MGTDFSLMHPVVFLAAFGMLAMFVSPFMRNNDPLAPARGPRVGMVLGSLSLMGIGVSAYSMTQLWVRWSAEGPLTTAFDMIRIDGYGLFISFVLLGIGALTVLMSMRYLEKEGIERPEFYALMLFALAGMLMMQQTTNLIMILIGLEIFSLALYVMTGMSRGRTRSVEAALKYFLLGAFSSGFVVYGMALTYGATGTLDLAQIAATGAEAGGMLLWLGVMLIFTGLAFKIALVPFHQWAPDVYTGAPTNVAGFMAAATKTAAIGVLLRLLIGALGQSSEMWVPMVTVLAILTMTVANLVALAQTNIKRLLAFSSIAHAGYLMIAVVSRPEAGVTAILFYLVGYGLMTIGAFAVLGVVGRGDPQREVGYSLEAWSGIGWRRPWLGVAMTIFLLSLTGIPLTAGFFGKYLVFKSAIEIEHYSLAIIGMLNAAVAAYYYLHLLVVMYMKRPEGEPYEPSRTSIPTTVVLVVSVLGVLSFGVMPGWLLNVVRGLAASIL
jgi:NADH-quinone oxidoreductase subunit N